MVLSSNLNSRSQATNPVRLVHVMPTFGLGGTELRVVSMMNSLGAQFSHCVISLNGVSSALSRVAASAKVDVVTPGPSHNSFTFPFKLYGLLRSLNPDLLLTYNWGAIDAVLAGRLGRVCPVIHNECGFGPDEAVRLKRRRVLYRRLLLNAIPRTIVVSSALRDIALKSYRVHPDRITLIPNGVDCNRFAPHTNEDLRASLGVKPNEVVFGYVGGLRPEKDPAFFLNAFIEAAIPGSRLVLVGDGPLRKSLQQLAVTAGIAERVVFAGSVAETPAWYNAMDVFLMSSTTEQSPNALLEAMASGLPAICTAVGDTARFLSSTFPDTVVPLGGVAQYVSAMRLLGGDQTLRLAAGEQNRGRCLAAYSHPRMIEKYRGTYLSVTNRPSQMAS